MRRSTFGGKKDFYVGKMGRRTKIFKLKKLGGKKIMKKRTLTLVLALVLALSLLTACGNSSSKNLTNNPSIESVKEAIAGVESITSIEIVTEDNDPNGQLGKQGGYTGCLYFKSSLVTDETNESAIQAGTDGGGSIEVYANKVDAEKRNEYLAVLDGTILSSGSHNVLGTLVIRTSNKLKAFQQTELETEIINALSAGSGKGMLSKTPQTDDPTQTSLLLDKEETRERINYRVASSWNKTNPADDPYYCIYLPYEVEEEGFFAVLITPLNISPIVDKNTLNKSIGVLEEQLKLAHDSFNLVARTDKKGIPIIQYEAKLDDSGDISKVNGFSFVYGDFKYEIAAVFPETDDSPFFPSTLTQIMDSLVIKEYTQSELPSDEGDIDAYHVKILDAARTEDYNGTPAIVVDFEFTNNANKAKSFMVSTNATAFQDGVELDMAIIGDESVYDAGLAQKLIKPGVSLIVQEAFVLASDSPVEIEVTKLISIGNDTVLTKTFNVK